MAQKSNEPAVIPQIPPAFLQLLGQMELEATQEDETFPSPMVDGIVKILSAESEEEMWDADDLAQTGGRDLEDIEQTILAYAVKYSNNPAINSAFKDSHGRGMYLLIRAARLDNGEEFVWNTSAPLVVGKIMWLGRFEKMPANVVVKGTGAEGSRVLKLKPIPKRAYPAEPF